jgi:hypothetical protein
MPVVRIAAVVSDRQNNHRVVADGVVKRVRKARDEDSSRVPFDHTRRKRKPGDEAGRGQDGSLRTNARGLRSCGVEIYRFVELGLGFLVVADRDLRRAASMASILAITSSPGMVFAFPSRMS